jgi:WD40 repeat protein
MAPCCRWLLPILALLLAPALRASPPAPTDAQGDPLPAGALARLGTKRFRDGNFINTVAVSPDGQSVAVGGSRGLRILDLATGKEVRPLKTAGVVGFAYVTYSPDGKRFAASDHAGRVQFWDTATGDTIGQIMPAAEPRRRQGNIFTFSGDGKFIAAGSEDGGRDASGHATVYEVATGKQTAQVEVLHNYNVRAFLSGDGKVLVTTGHYMSRNPAEERVKATEINQTFELWDAATGKELRKVRNEASWGVGNVTFSPDGQHMATAGANGLVVIWELATGKEVRRLAGRRNLGAFLAYSPDGRTLAAGSSDGAVQAWDVATGKRLGLYDVPGSPNRAGRLGFTGGGRLLAWGSTGQAVWVWDVLAEKSLTPAGGHQAAVGAVAFPAGGPGVVSASADGTVCFWDAAGKETRRVQLRDESMPSSVGFRPVNGVRLSPDVKYALGSTINGVALYELIKGREVCALQAGHVGGAAVGAFSPDGSVLASVGPAPQARRPVLRLYDVGTGLELRQLEGHAGDPRAVAFAPDGKTVASASTSFQAAQTSEVLAWQTGGGKALWRAERPQAWVQGLAFSPDGKLLAALEQTGAILLYGAADGREVRRLGIETPGLAPSAVAFSPDGRLLATTAHDPSGRKAYVRTYEVASGTLRQEFIGHDGTVTALTFAPDGRRLATGGSDTTVLLWDLAGRAGEGPPGAGPAGDELEALWAALGDADGRTAFRAMVRLEASPEATAALLARHVKPAEASRADDGAIAKLIAALDADDFDERQKAAKELAALGKSAEGALKKALAAAPSAEVRRALEDLLDRLKDKGGPPSELVRPLRAVEVLEDLGTPEARKLLENLARGRAEAPLTEAARAALARLGRVGKP